jgi:hypothetical protein
MDEVLLPLPEIAKVKAGHRHGQRVEVAENLLLDEDTVRNYLARYSPSSSSPASPETPKYPVGFQPTTKGS